MSFSKSGGFVRSFGAVSFVVIPAVLALLAALFIAACAKGKAGIGEAKTDAVSSVAAAAVMLDDALAEIRDFAPGEGVPAGVFDELRAELMRILEDSAGGPEGGRAIAKAPPGDSGLVTDFAYDLESRTLSWSYANKGDYDISGTVGVSDLTPIALNYGKSVTYEQDGSVWGDIETPEGKENHYLAWLDGDGDGIIGIGDITPIALNYLAEVTGYRIITTTEPGGVYRVIGQLLPFEGLGKFPVRFEVPLPEGYQLYVAVAPISAKLEMGAFSAPFELAKIEPNPHPWPMHGQNPQNTNLSPYAFVENPVAKWILRLPSNMVASPVVDLEGNLYVSGYDPDILYSISKEGRINWRVPLDGFTYLSPAIAADGTIFAQNGSGRTLAIARDGTIKYAIPSDSAWPYILTENGLLFFSEYDGEALYHTADGSKVWSSWAYSSLVRPALDVSGNIYGIYTIKQQGNLVCSNLSGTLWKYPIANSDYYDGSFFNQCLPAIGKDGTVYVGDVERNFYAVNPDGTLKWKREIDFGIPRSIAIGPEGNIYVCLSYKSLLALSPDGEILWMYERPDVNISQPIVDADGIVLIRTYEPGRRLVAINPDGSIAWLNGSIEITGADSPVVDSEGTIYVNSPWGYIAAFGAGPQDPVIHAVSPLNIKSGENVTLTVDCSFPADINWTLPEGIEHVRGIGTFVVINAKSEGVYESSARAYGYSKTWSDPFHFTLIVGGGGEPPRIGFANEYSNTIVAVQNEPITLNPRVAGTEPISYHWGFGSAVSPGYSNGESPVITPLETGLFDCTLTVLNAYGSDSISFTLAVGPGPVIVNVFPASGYAGEYVVFGANVIGEYLRYRWDLFTYPFGTSSSHFDKNPIIKLPDMSGVYNCRLTIETDAAITSTNFKFTVLEPPE